MAKRAKIEFSGLRHDGLESLFEKSPLRTEEGTKHMPLIIFSEFEQFIYTARNIDLLDMNEDNWVLCVWPGKKRSDVFRFQVGDLRKHIKKYPKEDNQVI